MKVEGGWRMSNGGWTLPLALAAVLMPPCATAASAAADGRGSVLDRLLGLRQLSWSTPDASLGWTHPLPAWAWVLIVIAAGALAGWSYSRLLGPRPVRLLLAGLRGAVILAVAVLLAGPTLINPDEREQPDALVILVDRSASMNIRDVGPAGGGNASAAPISRDESLRRALLSQAAVFGEQGLSAGARESVWLGFGGQVRELPPLTDQAAWYRPQAQADAPATALRTAIEQALGVAAGRPLASIILFTDGQSPQSTGADLVRQVARRGTRIHVVPLGPAEPGFDLMLGQLNAPEQAFANDIVPITLRIDHTGGPLAAARVRAELVDAATDEVIDEQTLPDESALREPVRLTARSEKVGQVRYRAQVVYEPLDPDAAPELVTSNNAREFVIDMIDRPVRVLYVEGYPRWEYRYLKNMLIREESIDSSILLLSADQAFAQEGDTPITRPPATPDEIRPYDVIILGDVPPDYFTTDQLTLIRDHVAGSGAGLLWIGGSRSTPAAYAGTALEDLLPMRSVAAVQPAPSAARIEVHPTPLAEALSVLQLRGPDAGDTSSAAADWPAELAPLRWAQDVGRLKPTAEVLADVPGITDAAGDPLPLLVRLRYGSGQSLYLATDETWRWRYGRGELYFEQFWVQLVRMLGRHRVEQVIDRARLSVSHRQVGVDEPVVVELTIEDPALLERQPPRIAVSIDRTAIGPDHAEVAIDRLYLVPRPDDEQAEGRRVYSGTWRPAAAGSLILRVTEPALSPLGLSRALTVVAPDDEMRHVAADHQRLAALAAATGGQVVPLDHLDRLLPIVPNLAEKTAIDTRESLWNSWLALVLVLGLLTTEWILRKTIWLV